MVDFPDHSAQEQMIRVCGNVELLYKRGKKIVRFKKHTYGTEDDVAKYAKIAEAVSGRVLNVGLGMANSADMILARPGVTELICYEIEQDFIDLYNEEHPSPDSRLTLVHADADVDKPTGTFDCIVFELPMDSLARYNKAKTYLTWAWAHLNVDGSILLPYDRFSAAAVAELNPPNADLTVYSKVTGRKPEPLFLRAKKAS